MSKNVNNDVGMNQPILLAASCQRNVDKLRLDGTPGMGNREWGVGNGCGYRSKIKSYCIAIGNEEIRMENLELGVGNGKWGMRNGKE